MCGRFTLRQPADLAARFQATWEGDGDLAPRFNVAPTQDVPIVVQDGGSQARVLRLARWGLIPSWAKDASIGSRLINARAETLDEKPSFRAALKTRRCLVPADGFFEWADLTPTGDEPVTTSGGRGKRPARQPLFFHRPDDGLFAFAGLYEYWRDPAGGVVTSCTIISTHANHLMAPYHERIAALLPAQDEAAWLADDAYTSGDWHRLLEPVADDFLTLYPVSTLVNSPRHDAPEILARVS